jgi:hypothetical protein
VDFAEQVAVGVEDLHAGERGGVDASVAIDLQAVGEAGGDDREQPLVLQVTRRPDVEGLDVVGAVDVVAAGSLVGAAVGDVQRALVGRHGDSVRLVKPIGDHGRLAGREVVGIDEVPQLRLRSKALEVAVGGSVNQIVSSRATITSLGELSRSPRHVWTIGSRSPVLRSIRLMPAGREWLPCSQTIRRPWPIRGHPVGGGGVGHQHRDLAWVIERQTLDLDGRRPIHARPRQAREVESVLVGEVHGRRPRPPALAVDPRR